MEDQKFLDPEMQQAIDWPKVAEHLGRSGMQLSLDQAPRQFAAGAANLNFLIELDGKPAVLRRPPSGTLPRGANDVAREYRVLSRLSQHYSYAPHAMYYCDDPSVMGVPFCISEFVDGAVICDQLPPTLVRVPGIGRRLGELVLDALASLHSVDFAAAGLADIGRPDGYLERQITGWAARGAKVLSDQQCESLNSLCEWLQASLPAERPVRIVHNDFKLDNMILDLDHLEVRGVVDWDMCTLGDPLLELAILLLYWGAPDDNAPYSWLTRMPSNSDGWMSRREVIIVYEQATGIPVPEGALRFYVVLALLRFAVVYAQLRELYARGQMKSAAFGNEDPASVDQIIDGLLEHAMALRDEKLAW